MIEKFKKFLYRFFSYLWVSIIAFLMTAPRDVGGAEINGFLAVLLWIVFVVLIRKNFAAISCILSTVIMIVGRTGEFKSGKMEFTPDVVLYIIVISAFCFFVYKIFFQGHPSKHEEVGKSKGRSIKKQKQSHSSETKSSKREKRSSLEDYEDDFDNWENEDESTRWGEEDGSSYRQNQREVGPVLVNGSEEYWKYRDAAENLYHAFANANSTEERRMIKSRGEKLKTTIISEYGSSDANANYIINTYLDLRL